MSHYYLTGKKPQWMYKSIQIVNRSWISFFTFEYILAVCISALQFHWDTPGLQVCRNRPSVSDHDQDPHYVCLQGSSVHLAVQEPQKAGHPGHAWASPGRDRKVRGGSCICSHTLYWYEMVSLDIKVCYIFNTCSYNMNMYIYHPNILYFVILLRIIYLTI